MSTPFRFIDPESSKAPSTEGTEPTTTPIKKREEPSPSQAGRFQEALDETAKKKELSRSREEPKGTKKTSLFGLVQPSTQESELNVQSPSSEAAPSEELKASFAAFLKEQMRTAYTEEDGAVSSPEELKVYLKALIKNLYTPEEMAKSTPDELKAYLQSLTGTLYTQEEIEQATQEKLEMLAKDTSSQNAIELATQEKLEILAKETAKILQTPQPEASTTTTPAKHPVVMAAALNSITSKLKDILKTSTPTKTEAPLPIGEGLFTLFGKPSIETVSNTETPVRMSQLDRVQLIEQIASHIMTLRTKELEEIVVDIKYPPLFAGSRITIQEFQQAKGQFNITFENLSPQARFVLESEVQQNRLHDALLAKGYMLQTVTIEVPDQKPFMYTAPAPSSDARRESSANQFFDRDREKKRGQK